MPTGIIRTQSNIMAFSLRLFFQKISIADVRQGSKYASALPSSVRYVGVDIKTLHADRLFVTRGFNFKSLSRTVWDG